MRPWKSTTCTNLLAGRGLGCAARLGLQPRPIDQTRHASREVSSAFCILTIRLDSHSTGVLLQASRPPAISNPNSATGRALMGLHFAVWGPESAIATLGESIDRLRHHPALVAELRELFDVLEEQANHLPEPLDTHMRWEHQIPLAVHSRASLDEIMAAFGRMTFHRRNRLRQGVDFDPTTGSDLFL